MFRIRRLVVVGMLLLVTAAAWTSADEKDHSSIMSQIQGQQEHVGVTQRYPLVSVPMILKEPTIDGTVDTREWYPAARLSRFMEYISGMAVRERTEIYLAYSQTKLFFAFQFDRPQNAGPPTDRDFFEVLIDAWHAHERYYNMGADLNGIRWDGIGPNVDRKAWEPKWDYKARVTDTGWEGEMAIELKEFGLDGPPAPGTTWGIDFVRNEKTPADRLAVWAFRGTNWHATKNLGHMVFTGRPLAIRVEDIGWMPDARQAGAKVLVANFSDQPVTLAASMELRKADKNVTMEFYPQIDSAMAENLPAAIGSPLKAELDLALKDYPVVQDTAETITVEPNSSKMVQLALADDPGKYLISYSIREGDTPLAGALVPVQISVPLAIKLESYLYSAQTVAYQVDLRRVGDKVVDGSTLHIIAQDPSGATAAEAKQPIAVGSQEVAGTLKFSPQPDSIYTVVARVMNGSEVAAENREPLRVAPKPEWLGNQIGLKKFVPPPFVPIEASDKQCKVLGSTYSWSGDSLMPNFDVFGRAVLAAPIAFSFTSADGKPLPLKISSFKLKNKDVEQAVYEFAGELAGKAKVTGTITVEFDGLLWYRLNIAPSAPLEIAASSLTFKVKPEFAKICTVGAASGNTVYSGEIPAEGKQSPFSFSYWIGGLEGGVQWLAENQRNWSNANKKDVAQITRDDTGGTLRVNFIDKPVTLSEPIDWSFGFIPTPSRVKPPGWGEFAFFQTGGIVLPPSAPPSEEERKNDPKVWKTQRVWDYYSGPAWQRDKELISCFIYHGYWQEIFGYPGTFDPQRHEMLKKSVKWLHGEGIKVIVYAGWGMNTLAPEWNDYGTEMIALPLYNSGYSTYRQCPTTLWQDWFIYKMAEMVKEYDIDGIFIDSVTSPIETFNYTEGMRWTDETGKLRGSYPILATRQWLKRLYKMWHGELKEDGIVYNHNSPPAVMAIETFQDVRTPSEFAQTHEGEFDRKFLDFYIAKNGGEQYGMFVEHTNKDWMGGWAKKKSHQILALAMPLNVTYKAVSLYDAYQEQGTYELGGQLSPWVWAANKWLNKSTAQYLPWWKNARYLTTSPADEQVLTALWLHKGSKALLCVSNLNKEPRKINVTLNLDEIGMSAITAEDAVTGQKVDVQGGNVSLDVDFERFRLIKIAPKQ